VIVIQLDDCKRTRPDWVPPERIGAQLLDRHPAEQVLRRDRLGGQLEETPERCGEVELHGIRVDRRDRHFAPRTSSRSRVGRVLENADREDDVRRRDRRAVVPCCVSPEVEGPGLCCRVDRPAAGQIRHEHAVRSELHEAGEGEGNEVAVDLGAGTQRVDGDRPAKHPLAVGRLRGNHRAGRWRRETTLPHRRKSDGEGDQGENRHEAADDRVVGPVHRLRDPAVGPDAGIARTESTARLARPLRGFA
jgi:hypothetical protein